MAVPISFKIKKYPFSGSPDLVRDDYHGSDWPVVYLIHNDFDKERCPELYVGETTSAYVRYGQHAANKERRKLNTIEIIFDDRFNKSAILDIEQSLIQLFEADSAMLSEKGSKAFKLQNKNGGQSNRHDYYDRARYQTEVELIWDELRKRSLAFNGYNEIRNSDLFKYSPYNSLTLEQENVSRDIIRDMIETLLAGNTGTAVIRGAAGTGKSIVMINMISTIIGSQKVKYNSSPDEEDADSVNDRVKIHNELDAFFKEWEKLTGHKDLKIAFVVPMDSIRTTFQTVFTRSGKGLAGKMVIGPNEIVTDPGEREYDVVFIDEAHRLKRRKALGAEVGSFDECCAKLGLNPNTATSLDFITMKSKYQVMVYDEAQTVKPADIPSSVMKTKLAARPHLIERKLSTQMRCEGGGPFIGYVDDILCCRSPKKRKTGKFEFKMYLDPNRMIDDIIALDKKEGLCRTVAGYGWEWISNKVPDGTYKDGRPKYKRSNVKFKDLASMVAAGRKPDIDLNGKKYFWNVNNSRWILKSAPEEIGCIHTTQGYDLNRVGVIFGPEIDYDPVANEITINPDKFFDKKVKEQTPLAELKQFIINAYKVMMVRGIKGCYVYAYNDELRKYLSRFIDVI